MALTLLLLIPTTARAQDYPSKRITMVIPFSPGGGGTDIIGRHIADGLQQLWNQPVLVENRPGAGSLIGSGHVARSSPDGHTILFTSGSITGAAAVSRKPQVDPVKDLIPVALGAAGTYLMVVGETVKAKNVQEFVAEAKSRKMLYATSGIGGLPHFAAELFGLRTGLEMTAVHYKGGAEMTTDLVGGRVDTYLASVTAGMLAVQTGKARPLAIAGPERITDLPDTPTLAESGIKGAEVQSWFGIFVPANTPDAIVQKINAGVAEVMSKPEAKKLLATNSTGWKQMSVSEFRKMVSDEYENWKKITAARNLYTD